MICLSERNKTANFPILLKTDALITAHLVVTITVISNANYAPRKHSILKNELLLFLALQSHICSH